MLFLLSCRKYDGDISSVFVNNFTTVWAEFPFQLSVKAVVFDVDRGQVRFWIDGDSLEIAEVFLFASLHSKKIDPGVMCEISDANANFFGDLHGIP